MAGTLLWSSPLPPFPPDSTGMCCVMSLTLTPEINWWQLFLAHSIFFIPWLLFFLHFIPLRPGDTASAESHLTFSVLKVICLHLDTLFYTRATFTHISDFLNTSEFAQMWISFSKLWVSSQFIFSPGNGKSAFTGQPPTFRLLTLQTYFLMN